MTQSEKKERGIEIASQIWKFFDFQYHEPYHDKSYYFNLYLVTLFRYGLLKNIEFATGKVSQHIQEELETSNEVHSKALMDMHDEFKYEIDGLNKKGVMSLISGLLLTEKSEFESHFPYIFDELYIKCHSVFGPSSGGNRIPGEVCRIMAHFSPNSKGIEVYNPFTSHGDIVLPLGKDLKVYTQMMDTFSIALTKLRFLAHNKSENWVIFNGDSVDQWNPKEQKFDLIISSPPFSFKLYPDEQVKGKWGIIKNCVNFLIEQGVEALKAEGKLVALIPASFLYNQDVVSRNLRKYLIENDWLEYLISLPNKILPNTIIKTVIIVINKGKKNKGEVQLIQADDLIVPAPGNKSKLDLNKIISYIEGKPNEILSTTVSNQRISQQGFDLNIPRYLKTKIDGEIIKLDGVDLNELGEVIKGIKDREIKTGKYVRVRNLNSDTVNFNLKLESIEKIEIPKYAFKIESSCLLMSLRWNVLRPTYFKYTNEPIFISSDIVAFKINTRKIDIQYLVNELNSKKSTAQVIAFVTGSTIPTLRKSDLLRIKIELPTLKEQKAKVTGIIESYFKTLDSEVELKKQLEGYKDAAFRELASMKHTFRQYIGALKSNVSGTRKFLKKNEGNEISLNDIYSINLNQTLGQHLNSIEGTIDSVSRLLESKELLSKNKVENLDLAKLIRTGQRRFKDEDVFKFTKIYLDKESFEADGTYLNPIIHINADDFYIIFSNIVSNAVDHGFKNSTKRNLINSLLAYDAEKQQCIIEISNNGKPMDKAFTLTHLITRGEKTTDSSGAGTGGADIKTICDRYKGTFELENIIGDEFPVRYILKFPLVNTLDYEN